MKNILLLGDRDANSVTHRELDAAIGLLPSGVKARWVGTDTPDATRTSQADAVWVVPGSPYRDDAVVYSAITSARTSGQPLLGTCGGFQYAGAASAGAPSAGLALALRRLACPRVGLRRITGLPLTFDPANAPYPLHFDYYHTTAAVYHKAAVDGRGKPTAWLQRSVFPPIGSTFGSPVPLGFELDMGLDDTLYDVPNIRAENAGADVHVRIGWFRAVTNNLHAFAAHSFADEMAHAAGRDTLEYLLDVIGPGKIIDLKAQGVDYSNYGADINKYPVDSRRLRRVSKWPAKNRTGASASPATGGASASPRIAASTRTSLRSSRWKSTRRAAFAFRASTKVADAGVFINPDRVRAQFEGAAVMGAGLAMFGEITAENGRIQQNNFDGFRVARMNDAPVQVNVHFVESANPPTGVGEPGVPPVIAALANAIFAATGKRVRELPISKTKLV